MHAVISLSFQTAASVTFLTIINMCLCVQYFPKTSLSSRSSDIIGDLQFLKNSNQNIENSSNKISEFHLESLLNVNDVAVLNQKIQKHDLLFPQVNRKKLFVDETKEHWMNFNGFTGIGTSIKIDG